MTRDEQLAVLLANALIDKEEYKQSSTRWFERWEKQKEQLEEFSDSFADLVKELTDLQILNKAMAQELREHGVAFDFICGEKVVAE